MRIYTRLAVGSLFAGALASSQPLPVYAVDSDKGRLVIYLPTANAVAIAGKTISVVVKGSAALFPKGVTVFGEGSIGGVSIVPLSGDSATVLVSIPPSTAPGNYRLTALAPDASGALVQSLPVQISVERDELVSRLDVSPSNFFAEQLGESRNLTIIAMSRDGTSHDVTESKRLRVISANTAVATVQGTVVSAAGHGTTKLSVSYQNWSVEVPVTVQ